MTWTRPKNTRLPELLAKLAELHQKLAELKVRQQLSRVVGQAEALKSLYAPKEGKS
jgi:hypothetical protein